MNDKINPDTLYTFFENIDKEVREKILLNFINNKKYYESYSLSYIFDKYQHKISENVKDIYIKTLSRDNYKHFIERENKIELFNFLYSKLEENEKQNIEFDLENIEKSVKDMISFLIKNYDKYKILLIQLINNELALEYIISSLIINNLEIDLVKEIIKLKELEWNIYSKISFRLDLFLSKKNIDRNDWNYLLFSLKEKESYICYLISNNTKKEERNLRTTLILELYKFKNFRTKILWMLYENKQIVFELGNKNLETILFYYLEDKLDFYYILLFNKHFNKINLVLRDNIVNEILNQNRNNNNLKSFLIKKFKLLNLDIQEQITNKIKKLNFYENKQLIVSFISVNYSYISKSYLEEILFTLLKQKKEKGIEFITFFILSKYQYIDKKTFDLLINKVLLTNKGLFYIAKNLNSNFKNLPLDLREEILNKIYLNKDLLKIALYITSKNFAIISDNLRNDIIKKSLEENLESSSFIYLLLNKNLEIEEKYRNKITSFIYNSKLKDNYQKITIIINKLV